MFVTAYPCAVILPVCLKPIKSMALGVFHQLPDDLVLNFLKEVEEAGRRWLVPVLLVVLMCLLVCLCITISGKSGLDRCFCSVHRCALTAFLTHGTTKSEFPTRVKHSESLITGTDKYTRLCPHICSSCLCVSF